jgi:D,D-heptose 1,7-bisphosphate phosphatase
MALTAAVFLDKDGTLLADEPYNVDPDRMEFAPGAFEGLRRLGAIGLPLIVISNQSGVALGRFPRQALRPVRARLARLFAAAGAKLAGFYYCPHDPIGKVAAYARHCQCRKPAPGLLLHAAQWHHIDLSASWLVGDILHDVEAGNRAGCRTVLLDVGNETEWQMGAFRQPDYCAENLAAAARIIANSLSGEGRRYDARG